jgi:hypothetical protein
MPARRAERRTFSAWVELSDGPERRRAKATDLSVGGMGISLHGAPLAPQTLVTSEFPLPGIGLPLELHAEVAWFDPRAERGGLRFVDVDPGLAELLGRFVDGRLAD